MSDDNDTIDTNENEPLFDEGNLVKMPEGDPAIDIAVLVEQRGRLEARVEDLERQMQQKEYELDLNGGLARHNVAVGILTGYAAAGHMPALAGETRLQAAMRYADELCTDFENRMEKRAAQFMKIDAMSRANEHGNPQRKN